jgi:ubiquinone/menaquinone biosynthesis C-methylase UbiE
VKANNGMNQINSSRYYRDYPISNPAYMVIRKGGKKIREYAGRYLKGRLLDIGCGEKKKRFLIGDCVEEYVGLDHKDSIHNLTAVDIIGTAYDIPVLDNSFDSILCTAVLEHLEQPLLALKESFRVLKPDGHALYTVPLFWHLHEEPRDFYRYTKYGLEHLFKEAGFEVVEIVPLSGFWLTFGSEWSYYIKTVMGRVLSIFSRLLIVINNIVFPIADRIDMKFNHNSTKWTWLYLVVVRKKQSNG